MNNWLGNISVNLKLALGFGLVLALTMLLALMGWTSLDRLTWRSDRMGDIAQLNLLLNNVRVSRLQYMLTNGDETAAQKVQVSVEAFTTQQQKLLGTFIQPENLKLLKEQVAVIGNFQQSLDKMRDAFQAEHTARKAMGSSAEATSELITAIYSNLLQMNPGDADRFAHLQDVSRVKEQFLLTLNEVNGYISGNTPDTEQKAFNQLDETIEGLKQRGEYFSIRQQDVLHQLHGSLASYCTALLAYKTANNLVTLTGKEMVAHPRCQDSCRFSGFS